MEFDLSDDHQYWDQTIPDGITLTDPAGNADNIAIAKQRPLTRKELAAGNGVYLGLDTVFLIPDALLRGPKPAPRWTVVSAQDPDKTFTVLDVVGRRRDASGLPQSWVLTCRDPIIVYNLRDSITIEQAGEDLTGTAVNRLWPSSSPAGGVVLYQSLPCRVQPQQSETVEEHGVEGQESTYLIYVSKQLVLPNVRECRVLWTPRGQTGTAPLVLARLAYREEERIDVLPTLDAVLEV